MEDIINETKDVRERKKIIQIVLLNQFEYGRKRFEIEDTFEKI